MDVDTGITSEVFTIKSETKLIDIFNNIINKKSEACLNYIDSLNLDKNTKIVVVGTYFTGVGIVKKLRKKYNNILLIDFYPHLKELLDTFGNIMQKKFHWKPWQQHLDIALLTCRKCSVSMVESTIKIICGASGLNMHCGNWRKRI